MPNQVEEALKVIEEVRKYKSEKSLGMNATLEEKALQDWKKYVLP